MFVQLTQQLRRKMRRHLPTLTLPLLLAPVVQAQDSLEGVIVDELAREESMREGPMPFEGLFPAPDSQDQEPVPPWRDLQPREYTSMVVAILVAAEDIPELTPWDKSVLSAAAGRLGSLNARAARHIDRVCWDVLSGKLIGKDGAPGKDGAREAGRLFALGDRIQEEDVITFFEEVVDSLSEEGRARIIQYKDEVFRNNTTANWMDWEKYAELAPEETRERITWTCEKRHGVRRRL